jgi:hypothetical protein
VRGGPYRSFDLVASPGTKVDDILTELRAVSPSVVQFGGHGCIDAPPLCAGACVDRRDVNLDRVADPASNRGLVLHDDDGSVHVVRNELIARMFALAGSTVKLVLISACDSEPLAKLLTAHVDCAIGVSGTITDEAALAFTRGCWAAIVYGDSVAHAYEAGRLAVECASAAGADRFKLRVRGGVDACHLVLAASRPENARTRSGLKVQRGRLRRGARVASASIAPGKRNRSGQR